MRFQFYRSSSGVRGGGTAGRDTACTRVHVYIYLQIPNSFQYVETR